LAISPAVFEDSVTSSFSFLESQFGMSVSHESNDGLNIFRYVGTDFAVDVYIQFYGGELGATIRNVAKIARTHGSEFSVETFLASFDDPDAPSLPGLMATTDDAARRLVHKLADGVEFVLQKLEEDLAAVFERASEVDSIYGRDLQLRRLRAEAARAWAAADWRAVSRTFDAIKDLKPPVELLPSELAKVGIARKRDAGMDPDPN
jgi:hypothetical protein